VASLGDSGNEGTNGLGAKVGGVGVGWGGLRGAATGDNWAKVVLEKGNNNVQRNGDNWEKVHSC
ncbi:hypothetical protein CR513_56028, partial [Mucuna pruriens]